MIRLFVLIICLSSFALCKAQPIEITFEALPERMAADPRPVIIFIHTSWCKYCAMMENGTLLNENVISTLDEQFYFIKLNAEEKSEIKFQKNIYFFQPSGLEQGVHSLAVFLGSKGGELNFPTICLLSTSLEIVNQKVGFMNADDLTQFILNPID